MGLSNDFAKRGVKLIALSCDEVDSHNGWIKDIIAYNNLSTGFSYPIIADPKREVATLYGMMDPDEKDAQGIPLTCRTLHHWPRQEAEAVSALPCHNRAKL